MGKLVIYLADGKTLDVPLDRERITIGRRPDNDVCLPFPAVSGEHAQVVTILADSFLEDLGSTNGTLVNGKAIAKHFLRDRDSIDIGRQRLTYLADANAKPDALPPDMVLRQSRGIPERVAAVRPTPRASVSVGARTGPLRSPLAAEDLDQVLAAGTGDAGARDGANAGATGGAGARDGANAGAAAGLAHGAPSMPGARVDTAGRRPAVAAGAERVNPTAASRNAAQTVNTETSGSVTAAMTGGNAATSADHSTRTDVAASPGALPSAGHAPPATSTSAGHASSRSSVSAGLTSSTAAAARLPASPRGPSVRVLSGASQGRIVRFPGSELTVGRVGVQVALVRRLDAGGFLLIPIEGSAPLRINGAAVAPEGSPLQPGDTFEVAGVRLELAVQP